MDDRKRGHDAADEAPRSQGGSEENTKPEPDKQDTVNKSDETDGGTAIKQDRLSSANDE